jgi:hypothetical protein
MNDSSHTLKLSQDYHNGMWQNRNKKKILMNTDNTEHYLNENGKLVWKHRTNKRLFLERAYSWVDSLIMIDETEDRAIIQGFKYSTYDFSAWELMSKEEYDSVKYYYKEIYGGLNLNELESRLDAALENETEESLRNWVHSKRKNDAAEVIADVLNRRGVKYTINGVTMYVEDSVIFAMDELIKQLKK